MTRYEVLDPVKLRECMAEPRRTVPYTVRTLADEVGANRTTIGYILTGERQTVDEKVAKAIAELFGRSLDELFAPVAFPSGNDDGEADGGDS